MTESDIRLDRRSSIRRQAEEILRDKATVSLENLEMMSTEETRCILHELRVHQIELEMQNEEQCRVQEELDAMRARYFDLYDMAPVGYCSLSEDGMILEANFIAATLMGETRRALVGKPIYKFISTDDRDIYYLHNKRLLEKGESQTCELRMMKSDGTRFWVRMDATAAKDTDGCMLCRVILVDISKRKLDEEEKQKADERLSQVQRLEALGTMVAGVAHNLNNVLAAIMAAASMREGQCSHLEDREAYMMIGTACKRGRDVLRSLLKYAKPMLSGREPIEVRALIDEVVHLLKNTSMNRIKIVTEYPAEQLWILGDAGSLDHSLMNLGINALDATPDGGTLTFRVARSGTEQVAICVKDTGCGMSPETLTHALEPFFTTKPLGKGTGLGLSMTYGVIKAHGGSLEIASELNRGCAVTLFLPRIQSPLPEKRKMTTESLFSRSSNVLLVDDDEDVRYLMSAMLTTAGFHVKSVESGESALEVLSLELAPDLVILDQNMPGMSGIQTMERIRILYPQLPILISSGQPDIGDWECLKRPYVAVITKPFDMAEIDAKLTALQKIL